MKNSLVKGRLRHGSRPLSTQFDSQLRISFYHLVYIVSKTAVCMGLMQYTRDPICFASRPALVQPVKNRDSSSFPILRLQLIRNAGRGNLNSTSASKRGIKNQQDCQFQSLLHISTGFAITVPPFCSFSIGGTALLSLGL